MGTVHALRDILPCSLFDELSQLGLASLALGGLAAVVASLIFGVHHVGRRFERVERLKVIELTGFDRSG